MSQVQTLQPGQTVEQWLDAHKDADPRSLFQVLCEQNDRIRNEYKISSEVELDDNFNFKPKTMAQLLRVARMYAESGIVPDHYKNNIAACAIAIQMALRCRVNILTFLQQSYIVYGKCGVEAKLAIAMLIVSGKVEGRIRYKFAGEGKSRACTAFVTDKESGEEFQQTLTWATVEAEGWDKEKKGQISKWVSMPDIMFQYRSGMFLIRAYYPDVLLGMLSLDELEDIGALDPGAIPTDNGAGPAAETIADLSNRLGAAAKPGKRKKAEETQQSEPPADPPAENKRKSRAKAPDQKPADTPPESVAEPVDVAEQAPAESAAKSAVTTPKAEPAAKVEPKAEAPKTEPKPAGKRQMTVEGAVSYMEARYQEDDVATNFDLNKIAKLAIGQPQPTIYMDQILTRSNPNFVNFLARELPAEDVKQDAPEDAAEGSPEDASFSQDAPEFITNPIPRPGKLSPAAAKVEGTILKFAVGSSIRRMQISKENGLTTDETAYLMDLAERRAWQLDRQIEPTDTIPGK